MAKTTVSVIGMADRTRGTKKDTGATFDFCRVAFSFTNQFNKNDVAVVSVQGVDLDKFNIKTGDVYLAVVNQINKVYYIDLIEPIF